MVHGNVDLCFFYIFIQKQVSNYQQKIMWKIYSSSNCCQNQVTDFYLKKKIIFGIDATTHTYRNWVVSCMQVYSWLFYNFKKNVINFYQMVHFWNISLTTYYSRWVGFVIYFTIKSHSHEFKVYWSTLNDFQNISKTIKFLGGKLTNLLDLQDIYTWRLFLSFIWHIYRIFPLDKGWELLWLLNPRFEPF